LDDALIRLDGYPAPQYGALETSVARIALLPQSGSPTSAGMYTIDLHLPDTLCTTYGKIIPFRQEMSGQVRIITENRRVIARLFDRLRDLLRG
jgi:hypothetical protein